ncbi:MAG: transglycosylase domain-containing protein [Actinomycetota bacterium]
MSPRTSTKRLKVEPRNRIQKVLLRWGWVLPLGAIFVGGSILVLTYAFASIPLPEDIEVTSSAEVYDVNGNRIGTFTDEVTRFLIDEKRMEKLLDQKEFIGDAVIAAEDRDFYDHNGVSVRGIIRAAWANLTGGEVQQGGSTITQQYIKNAVLHDPSRTVTRKIKEAVLAIKLERRYSKDQILGFYLNTIYFGRGAYGIEAAARAYFGHVHAEELTLSEMAYLAGIIPAPESYQIDDDPIRARERRDRVLDLMVQENLIKPAEAGRAKAKKLKLHRSAREMIANEHQPAAYFMEWLRKKYLYPEYGNDLYTRGLKIYTTIDMSMQDAAEDAVAASLGAPGMPEAGLVSMTTDGQVRAMVGGKDFDSVKKARGFNYATDFPGRQPGSSFKPFTLLSAIEEGISPASRFSGASPMTIDDPLCESDGSWEVENYGGSSYGTITLDQATTNSVNTVYAQLISEVGPERVKDTVEDFGFAPKYGQKEIGAFCSQALGGALDVTPLEQARAYAGFAGQGLLPKVTPVLYITDSEGNCIKEYVERRGDCEIERKSEPERVVDANSANVLTQSLTHVVEGGTATAANIGRPVAGKTGTSQENRDVWFAGYTPQLTTAVWVGYPPAPGPDGKKGTPDDVQVQMRYCAIPEQCRPVNGSDATGGTVAAPIWAAYMLRASEGMEIELFPVPEDLPDEVINSPAPVPTVQPSPDETKKPDDEEEPEPEPSAEPPPEQSPSPPPPDPTPTLVPSPTTDGDGRSSGPAPRPQPWSGPILAAAVPLALGATLRRWRSVTGSRRTITRSSASRRMRRPKR